MTDTKTEDQRWEEWHRLHFSQNQSSLDSAFDSLDKNLLALSSGALGVSLAFIKDIVPLDHVRCVALLLLSWFAFSASIISTLLSFKFSIAAHKKQRDALDKALLERKAPESGSPGALEWSNICSAGFFILGLLCTLLFVGINVIYFHAADSTKQEIPTTSAPIDVRNYYMTEPKVEKVVVPQSLKRGREPMKTIPPPSGCPTTPPSAPANTNTGTAVPPNKSNE
jgi:hypothetical protein